jgi:2-polyprenyl-3-methyl-5-hydroxy-6-metoxy-1,4-benzoquinol methylase
MEKIKMKRRERANNGIHQHVANVVKDLSIQKDDCILDIGCGTGAFLESLKECDFNNLYGIDIKLPVENIDGVSFYVLDLDEGRMEFEEKKFKLIVSIEVFEHIENMGVLLKEISRVLSKDGLLILTTPNVHSVEARLRNLFLGKLKQFDELSDPTHIYPIFLYPFERLLRRYSLEIDEIWGYPVDGHSPTSRGALRLLSKILKFVGLKSNPSGDHLCMKISRIKNDKNSSAISKSEVVSSHY